MKRQIIEIDDEKCDGCGECVPECHEGALQIIDGKARLISDLFCDGLGACLGHCPQGAIEVVEREAEPYDEIKVLNKILKQPVSVLKAHLLHLLNHEAYEILKEALNYLAENGIENPLEEMLEEDSHEGHACGCQGSKTMVLNENSNSNYIEHEDITSELRQWPVQLHLVNANAPYFKNSELVIMATCVPIANPNIHRDYLKGRSIVVACPKLDYTQPYTDKLTEIFKIGGVTKAIVVIMQVPCCSGLMKHALDARIQAGMESMPIEEHILSLDGKVLQVRMS